MKIENTGCCMDPSVSKVHGQECSELVQEGCEAPSIHVWVLYLLADNFSGITWNASCRARLLSQRVRWLPWLWPWVCGAATCPWETPLPPYKHMMRMTALTRPHTVLLHALCSIYIARCRCECPFHFHSHSKPLPINCMYIYVSCCSGEVQHRPVYVAVLWVLGVYSMDRIHHVYAVLSHICTYVYEEGLCPSEAMEVLSSMHACISLIQSESPTWNLIGRNSPCKYGIINWLLDWLTV